MSGERVLMDEVIRSAERIIIRTGVGWFASSGPRGNIMTVESLVAFSTTVNELYREGYEMVPPEEYARRNGIGIESVYRKAKVEGSLFLLSYPESSPPSEAVPMEEKAEKEGFGGHLL